MIKLVMELKLPKNVKGIHNKSKLGLCGYLVYTVRLIVERTTLKMQNRKNK